MVKSGLEKEILENNSKIARVSPYRLAAHLTSAILLYILTLSNGLHILGATRSSRPSGKFSILP